MFGVVEERQVVRRLASHGGGVETEGQSARGAARRGLGHRARRAPRGLVVRAAGRAGFGQASGRASLSRSSRAGGASAFSSSSGTEPVTLDDDDHVFLRTVASQGAQALDRARHFESERSIAETLQRSVLPVALPRMDGVQIAARYLPGMQDVDVGGDWFDAVELSDGRLGLVVGDVVGKGVHAAANMGQLRNALRAFSIERLKPQSALAKLDRLASDSLETTFATVVYAIVDTRPASCGSPRPGIHRPPSHIRTAVSSCSTRVAGFRSAPASVRSTAKASSNSPRAASSSSTRTGSSSVEADRSTRESTHLCGDARLHRRMPRDCSSTSSTRSWPEWIAPTTSRSSLRASSRSHRARSI